MRLKTPTMACAAALAAFALTCGGCRTPAGDPADGALAVPEAYGGAGAEAVDAAALSAFIESPGLDALLRKAFADNPGLSQAAARLEQAAAAARAGGADVYPQVSAEGKAARGKTVSTAGASAGQAVTSSLYNLGLAASYELDLWGRIGAADRAGRRDAEAAEADWRAARVTLAAQMAEAWFGLAAQRETIELLTAQAAAAAENLRLVELRYRGGLESVLAVLQQREQVAAAEALLPGAKTAAEMLRHQLAVLAGLPPSAALPTEPQSMFAAPVPVFDLGIPAELLTARPDVRAALIRVRAADERVAAAVAARLPAIRLSGSAGYATSTIEELFDTSIWNLAGSLAEPLIDGGRKRAEVDRSKAVRDERLARAEEVLLTAVREVEDAWSGERGQRETAELAAKRRDAARVAHEQARSRYGKGLSDYLVTLISQDRLRVAERELVAARRQLMAYRIQLWRALGAPGLERAVSPPVDGGRAGSREGSENDE